jgi:hypothetical protein
MPPAVAERAFDRGFILVLLNSPFCLTVEPFRTGPGLARECTTAGPPVRKGRYRSVALALSSRRQRARFYEAGPRWGVGS